MSWNFHRSLAVLGLVWLALFSWPDVPLACAQLPNGIKVPQSKDAVEAAEPPRPLDAWQAEVKSRLEETEQRVAALPAGESADELNRRHELLGHLELTLAQAIAESDKTEKLQQDLQKQQASLAEFRREGTQDSEAVSFHDFDETRDELATEKRRLSRLTDNVESAAAALETARRELRERASARRQAREGLEANKDETLQQSLANRLEIATLRSEDAEAEARLRELEAANARSAREAQQLRVDLLEERVARLGKVARFDATELKAIESQLDRRKIELDQQIAELEAAKTKENVLETLWMEAQKKLDAGEGDSAALTEQVETYRLELRAIQEQLPLLREQLERLADGRTVWRRRQQAYGGHPPRESVREWIVEAQKATTDLKVEEDNARLEIDELQTELNTRESSPAAPNSSAGLAERQLASLRTLLDAQSQNLASIRASQQLHAKLLAELESDTLAATARDRLYDVWSGVEAVWNYELTSFGESPLTVRKVVLALALILAGAAVSRTLSRMLGRQVLQRLKFDASASATIQSLSYYALLLCFGLFALKVIHVPLTAFTVLGGAVALGVGFGSQNIINNFISGLILHAERPVKVGDLIQLGDLFGNVEHIGARSTRVRTGSNLDIIVPNSTFLQNNVINFTLSSDKVRTSVEVGVVYGSPVVAVTQLLRRAVLETGRVSKDPPPIILFKDFGPSALVFEIHFWLHMRTMMDRLQVESSVRYQIEQLFNAEGIAIAFPQTDVHLDTTAPLQVRVLPPPQEATYP